MEAALAAEMKERSSLLETLNGMHQKMSEPNNPLFSDQESALHVQVLLFERGYHSQIVSGICDVM